jgi:hypothetical protein
MIITKTEGFFIINSGAVALDENTVVTYPADAVVQEFDTEEEMLAAHQAQFPEQYEEE